MLKLSLRDLFWLTTLAAVCFGSWIERVGLNARIHKLENPEWDFRSAQEVFNSPHPFGISGAPLDEVQ
jgi:hypothetical protein